MDGPEFSAFNADDWKLQDEKDDAAMRSVLDAQPGEDNPLLIDMDRPLEVGEKADDAEDFEDISDDDLPEEEDATGVNVENGNGMDDMFGHEEDDDLFGDGGDAFDSFEDVHGDQANGVAAPHTNGVLSLPSAEPEIDLRELNFPSNNANPDADALSDVGDVDEFLKEHFPAYQKGAILDMNALLPPKQAKLAPKVPLKPPKAVHPGKVSLDIAPDQEKNFRIPGPSTTDKYKRATEAETRGFVPIIEESSAEDESEDEFDYSPFDPNERIGGLTMTDLEMICMDFESKINPVVESIIQEQEEKEDEEMDEWDAMFLTPATKRKAPQAEPDFIIAPHYALPNFDNFEAMTAQIAKRVVLDLNDPHLLVDIQEFNPTANKRRRLGMGGNFKRTGAGGFKAALAARFNTSNDAAYVALKDNHTSKVRATIGNMSVEHSMPAIKLQWPYYRVKLLTQEARSFHRPALKFNKFVGQSITFSKPGMRKKKTVKGLSTADIFKETKDLSLSDHYSTATLLEYSEEHPTVLSNFGMGNRIVNYYRRTHDKDNERPQPEDKIGDVQVLLPEDKSPFSNFGMVDPGETVRAIHNSMYRAPIFKHDPKNTDFLVIRSSTGVHGTAWHIRNIDSLFVVGQQFPSMEIPGPHSRKVTNAAKNRMKMIAFRKVRHNPNGQLKIGDITAHISDSTDMQNRQKLKEFMHYDKTEKVWRMKPGDIVPEESVIRSMVKPEEVCVIDAMQVGARHLIDSGYAAQDDDEPPTANENADEKSAEQKLEESLAPWKTSKAFLEASADKAMLELHGAGDPSGAGLAFSLLKTSMKGGFLEKLTTGPGSSTETKMFAVSKGLNNGHTYNVKNQQALYNEAIRKIWEKQKESLTNTNEDNLFEVEDDHSMATPAPFDDNASVFSSASRVMKITRTVRNEAGQLVEVTEMVKDPKVWRSYEKRRKEIIAEQKDVYALAATDMGSEESKRLKDELERLKRNRDRRFARENQKKGLTSKRGSMTIDAGDGLSPASTPTPSIEKPTGTTRKCANCGASGHIKTNKKYCNQICYRAAARKRDQIRRAEQRRLEDHASDPFA